MIECNRFQTQLTDELLSSLHQEVRDQLLEYIANVKFIQRLIDPNRKYAKDLPKDKDGKIIVDILNPHILENMDYFRPTAKYFEEHGVLTHLRPNSNPNSEFGKWMKTEIERIWYGMVRPEDGEWITGQMYWYLNYTPIIKDDVSESGVTADRVSGFPNCWEGIYMWFHYLDQARHGGIYNNFIGGQHAGQIAKRQASKSYSISALLSRLFVVGDSPKGSSKTRGVVMAHDKEKLIKDGTLNKFLEAIDFQSTYTQFPAARIKSTLDGMQWKMGYKDKVTGVERGTLNEIMGAAINDDPDKIRGKRAQLLVYEEFGAFPKFLDVWNTNRRSVQSGNISFGQAVFVGTGGSEGANFYGALQMIYSPKAYNVYALPNYYDKGANGDGTCVFFFGAYLNRPGHANADGVSDVTGALIEILKDRYTIKYNATDATTLTRAIAEDPITIQEAIMRRDGSIFPAAALADRLNELKANPKILDETYVGSFKIDSNGNVEFDPAADVKAIRHFPHQDNKIHGAVEIYKMPEKDNSGRVFGNRYIFGIDPYDDDVSMTSSLGSIIGLDLWTDKIVCEYTGRPQFADEFYEICRRMALFYNGSILYESQKKGIFGYFSRKNSIYLLNDVPTFLRDRDMIKGELYGNKSKGCPSLVPIQNYARRELRDWLLKETFLTEIDSDGNEIINTIPNLMHIKSPALLEELIQWNCMTGDNYVLTNNGNIMISNLDKKDYAISTDGLGHELLSCNSREYVGEVNIIESCGNRIGITTTPNHPILTARFKKIHKRKIKPTHDFIKKEQSFKQASEVNKNDFLFVAKRKKRENINVSDELKYLLGWILSDGYIPNHKNRLENNIKIYFQYDQEEIMRDIIDILYKNFPTYLSHNGTRVNNISCKVSKSGNMFILNIHSKSVREFAIRYLGISPNKYIKPELFRSDNMIPFLKGYFEGDGHYHVEKTRRVLSVTTKNLKEALDVRQILLDEGIWCAIHMSKGYLLTNGYLRNNAYTIRITHNGANKIIIDSKKFRNKGLINRDIQNFAIEDENGYWSRVKLNSIKKHSGLVYNLSVADMSNYVANGITNHNCDNNYDRVDACAMLMLLRQEKLKYMEGRNVDDLRNNVRSNYLGNDPFFKKNGPKNIK